MDIHILVQAARRLAADFRGKGTTAYGAFLLPCRGWHGV